MVRFKDPFGDGMGTGDYLSIPIWFDLKRVPPAFRSSLIALSIPIWFDLKLYTCLFDTPELLFQFLYGSI